MDEAYEAELANLTAKLSLKSMTQGGHELTLPMAARTVRQSFRHQDLCSDMTNDSKEAVDVLQQLRRSRLKRFTPTETSPS